MEIASSNLKVGSTVSIIIALVLGVGLVILDKSHFFVLYFTKVVPLALTAGGLAYFMSLACKDIISRSSTSDKDKES